MRFIVFLIRTSWQRLLLGIIGSVLAAALYAWSIKLLHELFNAEVSSTYSIYLLIGAVGTSTVISIYSSYYLTKLYELKISELRTNLTQNILQADFENVEANRDRIVPVLQIDVNTLAAFTKNLPEMIVAIFKILVIWIYMFVISWKLAAVVIGVFAFIFVVNLLLLPTLHREERKIQWYRNQLHIHLDAMAKGIKELTLNLQHKAGYIARQITPNSVRQAVHITRVNMLNITVTKVAELIVILALAILVVFVRKLQFVGTAELFEFLTLILFVLPSLIVVTTFFRNLKKVDAALEQIDTLGVAFGEATKRGNRASFSPRTDMPLIRLKGVTYRYQGGDQSYQVGPIDLEINANDILLINGGNGSGKTTLSKLLTGLYAPYQGELLFCGQPVNAESLDSYRDQFSAVYADSHVFQHLNYLAPSARQLAESLVDSLSLREKIVLNDLSISSTSLSFGQRGRLSLLRVLLEDKPIMLFDEWAANQDVHFKSKFYQEIIPSLKAAGKTIILISHDEAYYHVADQVVTLANGLVKRNV